MTTEKKLPKSAIIRNKPEVEPRKEAAKPIPVSGNVGRVIDLAFDPSHEKIREVTVIDRVQGRLFPLIDMVNLGLSYVIEIACYRKDAKLYKKNFEQDEPIPPNFLDEFLFRTAQWQKSVAGKNLERAIDIALAETEAKAMEDNPTDGGRDPWD